MKPFPQHFWFCPLVLRDHASFLNDLIKDLEKPLHLNGSLWNLSLYWKHMKSLPFSQKLAFLITFISSLFMTIRILSFELFTLFNFEINTYFWIQSINGFKYFSNMIIIKRFICLTAQAINPWKWVEVEKTRLTIFFLTRENFLHLTYYIIIIDYF